MNSIYGGRWPPLVIGHSHRQVSLRELSTTYLAVQSETSLCAGVFNIENHDVRVFIVFIIRISSGFVLVNICPQM